MIIQEVVKWSSSLMMILKISELNFSRFKPSWLLKLNVKVQKVHLTLFYTIN